MNDPAPRGRCPAELNGKAEQLCTLTDCQCDVESSMGNKLFPISLKKLPNNFGISQKSADCGDQLNFAVHFKEQIAGKLQISAAIF